MRKILAAPLAIPVYAAVYLSTLVGRSLAARMVALALGGILVAGGMGVLVPAPTQGYVPTAVSPLAPDEFQTEIRTGEVPRAAVTVAFPSAMDEASVAASLRVTPRTRVELAWDHTGSFLTVQPETTWLPGTYYTITVGAGALDATGRPTTTPARAAFLVRPPTSAAITATDLAGDVARIDTALAVTFDRPIDESTLALATEPHIDGSLEAVSEDREPPTDYRFVPDDPLAPGATYSISFAPGLLDTDGAPVSLGEAVVIRTAEAPAVVRFRPRDTSVDVATSQSLSVRFSEPMDETSTAAAWSASVAGTALAGSISFAENSTVLVFKPKAALPYGTAVVMVVGASAASQAGVLLGAPAAASFTTVSKPAPAPTSSASGSPPSSVGEGTWAAVETHYLKLMNCTRTGGWVTSSGACSSPGGRDVAPLWIDSGISTKVSRPYAKLLATRGLCNHFIGGNPGDRLRRAGYTSYIWAENLGCRSGDSYAAVLGSHLFFQSEKPYLGGHYVHIMDAKYDRVGLGVWVSGGRVRLVVDFYHPR